MKKLYFYSLAWIAAFGATLVVTLASSPVYAAGSLCYIRDSGGATNIVNCSNVGFATVATAQLGHPLRADNCYIFNGNVVTEAPLNKSACTQAVADAAASIANSATPPVCYKVRPDISTIRVDCSNLLFATSGAAALGHPLTGGNCYIAKTSFVEAPLNSSACVAALVGATVTAVDAAATGGGTTPTPPGGLDTSSITDPRRKEIGKCDGSKACINKNPVIVLMKWAVNILTAVVGIVVVGVIIFAGIEYSSSGGDPGRTGSAKKRIINAIIALVAFMFLYIGLQWLIPGGLFA